MLPSPSEVAIVGGQRGGHHRSVVGYRHNGGLLAGLQHNALAFLVHFVNKVSYECKCIALEASEEATIVL